MKIPTLSRKKKFYLMVGHIRHRIGNIHYTPYISPLLSRLILTLSLSRLFSLELFTFEIYYVILATQGSFERCFSFSPFLFFIAT